MISHVLLSILAAAPGGGPPLNANAQRQAFSRCVSGTVTADTNAGVALAAFQAKLGTLCKAEEAAFRAASIRADLSIGIRQAAAEKNAADEVRDILETQTDRFRGNTEMAVAKPKAPAAATPAVAATPAAAPK